MNNRKAPRIRFKGFTDDWEQRKLGEIASSFEYGLNAAAKEFDGKNKYIRITDIYDDSREFDQNNVTSPDIDLLNADSYKLTKGDILFARTGASVGKTYIYKDFDGLVYYAGFLIRAKIKDSYIPEFIFQSTLTKAYEKFIKVTSMRSGQPGVNAQEYSQFELMIPEKPEQDKIGIYFTSLDQLITLHQRKLEKLKIVKKAMLENCFPKNGEKVPKFRFSGFSGDWEQRKVSEIFKITRGYVLAATETADIKDDKNCYPVYSSQTKNEGLMGFYSEYLYENAITWTTDGANAGTVRYRSGKFYCTNVCGVLLSEEGYANKAVSEALNSVAWKYVSHVGNPKLMNNVMADIEIVIPKLVKEQETISRYFDEIDHLITLHQRKLEKLKIIKKSFLEKMFV